MATCGEDEFGNLYADVHVEDVGALRGFGSLYWSCEDESDSASREGLSGDATNEHCHQRAQSVEEEGEATFIHSNGVSPAQGACKKDHLTETVSSKHYHRDVGGAKDKDDDLHIVLNPLQVVNEGSGEDSEDGEDFVILAGNEAMNDQEWQEESCMLLEDKAQALLEGGEKLGTLGDGKGQNGKSPRVQPRIGYGSQVYHRHFQYVRGSGLSRVGASVSARVVYSNNGKPDRFGGGRGFTNCQRVSLPSRRTGTSRGLSCGLEYSIPSNKTVFDVDIDALKEKPWSLPHVDVSDYFNFGFDENSWKRYCKQLAQFCLEMTTQSKISVYEGGRTGQSTIDAIEVGGGCEPWSSANIQGQQIRESDAIFLVDVKDDHLSRSCSEDRSVDSGAVNIFLQNCSSKSDVALGIVRKNAQPTVENTNWTSVTRLCAEPQKCGVGSGKETQVNGSVAICPGEGWTPASASRPKALSPSTPPERLPTQDKRDTERGKSQSSSLNDGSQIAHTDYMFEAFHRNDHVEREEKLRLSDYVKARGRQRMNAALKFCADNCLSGRLDVKRGSCHAIASRLSKKRRLGLHNGNHGAHHSIQVVKKLSRPHTSSAVLGAYKGYAKAEITQPKNLTSLNNTIEIWNGDKSGGQYVNGSNEQHVVEKTEMKANFLSLKTESKKSKGQGETDSSKVKERLQGIHCKSSKEKLKAKNSRKGRKHKERTKAKGCPNVEKGQVEGFDGTLLIQKEGTGDMMSLISFVSKDNGYYWKKVENMSLGDIQDQGAKKLKSFWQCHEIEYKTEAKSKTHKSNERLLGHLEIGGDQEIKKEGLKLDGNPQRESANSWKPSRVSKSKKKGVKHKLSGEIRVALANTGSLANSTFETHAKDSMQVSSSKQVSTRQKRKHSESKESQVFCKRPHLESEDKAKGLPDLAVPSEQRCKKHRSKKLRKTSRRNSSQSITAGLAGQQKQDGVTSNLDLVKDVELVNGQKVATSTLICGRGVDPSDFNDKNRKDHSKIFQTEIYSPKDCGSKLPNLFADTLNGNSDIGSGTRRKLPNLSMDTVNGNSWVGFDMSRLQIKHSTAEGLHVEQESVHATLSDSSQEEERHRGRSKFERWTSHSEQVTHDSRFGLSDMQNVGRSSLSRKVPASKFGQRPDEPAPECMKQGDNYCAAQSEVGKKWMVAKYAYKGKARTMFREANNLTVRKDEQQSAHRHLDQFVAKLEKRRERFKLSMMEEPEPLQSSAVKDERELLPRSAIKALPLTDRVVRKLERPARKRCWGGG